MTRPLPEGVPAAPALVEVQARVVQAHQMQVVAELLVFLELSQALRLLVDRVTVGPTGMAVDLRNNGIAALVRDLADSTHLEAAE